MKKIIKLLAFTVLIVSTLFFTSCSEDDNQNDNLNYTVSLEETCGEDRESYCITKEEYERIGELLDSIPPNDPCIWISIKDKNNNRFSGYFRSRGASSSSNSICN